MCSPIRELTIQTETDKQANGLNIRVEIKVSISTGRVHGLTVDLAWRGQKKVTEVKEHWSWALKDE